MSMQKVFLVSTIGLCAGSHIFDDGTTIAMHGEMYLIDAGTIKKIRSTI